MNYLQKMSRYDHTESVDIDYDPSTISYSDLLKLFWSFHDPTVPHKRQYMSAIFYHSDEQKHLAEESFRNEQQKHKRELQTQILPNEIFYEAENYHQKYLLRNHPSLFHALELDGPALIRSHVAAKMNGFCGGYGSAAQLEQESENWNIDDRLMELLREAAAAGVHSSCGI